MKVVKFKKWECELHFSNYIQNGRIAIELIDIKNGDIVAIATANLPGVHLQKDEVIIKSYSENEGMYECLLKAGVIGPRLRQEASGFVKLDVCKLLIL